jgi:alcohol dehydrogenase class IV
MSANEERAVAPSVFAAPERVIFGAGSVRSLGEEVRRLGRRPLVVTGRQALAQAGVTGRILEVLRAAGADAAVFAEVEPEPDLQTADRCREALRRHGADLVIGLGGGSALDVAKVAAALAREGEPTRTFHQGRPPGPGGLPIIALPTTGGTGSEMTNNGVLSDRAARYKASIRHAALLPRVALVDPELALACPPRVTAASGVDALVQAIESYFSVHATPMTEALSLRAVEELAAALPAVVEHGGRLDLRTRAAWGSAMAGLALSNARLGVVHGMAHPIGVRCEAPHGLVCGVLLPAALDFNRPAAPEKYRALATLVGRDPAAYALDLLAGCGLPATLASYGLGSADFDAIAEETLASGSTKANPRPVTKADVVALLEKVD